MISVQHWALRLKVSSSSSCIDWLRYHQLDIYQSCCFDGDLQARTVVQMTVSFLVQCLKPSIELETFTDLRVDAFNRNALVWDFEENKTLALQFINRYKELITSSISGSKLYLKISESALALSI